MVTKGNNRLISETFLHTPAEIGTSRGKVAWFEDERDLVEEPAIEPLVDPRHLGNLVERSRRGEHLLDDSKEVPLQLFGERRDGKAGDHEVDLLDPALIEDL